jgi:hypothetical protein
LKGKGDGNLQKQLLFKQVLINGKRMIAGAKGSNEKNLYFHSNGKLSFDKPGPTKQLHLVVYISIRRIRFLIAAGQLRKLMAGSRWYHWLTEDQRFVVCGLM